MNLGIHRMKGLTLIELLVTVTIITLLIAVGLPAFQALRNSFESGEAAGSMISSALASARAMAMNEQRYVGVRFQKAYHPAGPLKASQYMILIVHDPDERNGTDLKYGFRALQGVKPIKLPDSVGVMDLALATNRDDQIPVRSQFLLIDDNDLPATAQERNAYLDELDELTDVTTFSVLFSPQGQLVVQGVWVRNRDGARDTDAEQNNISLDEIFNKRDRVTAGYAMFYQDDYFGTKREDLGLGPEASRLSFIVYDRIRFAEAYTKGQAWTGYLVTEHQRRYINRYTGTLIGQPTP